MRGISNSRGLLLSQPPTFRQRNPLPWAILAAVSLCWAQPASADDLEDAQALFYSGKYAECIEAAVKGVEDQRWRESWWYLKIQAEMATGQYAVASTTLEKALERFSSSIRLRLLGRRVYLFNDDAEKADSALVEAEQLAERQRWRYYDSASRVLLGQLFLLRGADPKEILESFFDRARRDRPDYVETYLATGRLALEKHDYALAAESFAVAAKITPDDPAVHFHLAQSYAPSDSERAKQALAKALDLNPYHAESHLMMVDRLIDAEEYEHAEELLKDVLKVNAAHPAACAYCSVLAHLEGDQSGEQTWRAAALAHWSTNPEVDHLVGRKLSQKYRFAEGAACQRRALGLDPAYLPAKMQLSQDLLRLGEEEEGWRLAEEVYEKDPYDVAAYNLATLHETLADFTTLESPGFLLRMEAFEADVYGRRALELLEEAKRHLCAKYDVVLPQPVVVEVFPERKDFAVRTFGMPGGEGFLGVCFGNVITANSPASQGESPANWQAVLWHEFCHVVTLRKTKNKMPRWLSEGISVYEEKQRNPAWGQSMNAGYRRMVLDGGLVPVSGLSGGFLSPPTPIHLQFAYYEASLVVEYLVETYGIEVVKRVLDDLATGASINVVLARHTVPLAKLDEDFAAFAEERARGLAPKADWEPADLPRDADLATLAEWSEQHPNNLAALQRLAERLVTEKRWQEAKRPLEKLVSIYPGNVDADGPYRLLATVHRELGETDAERSVLEKLAALDGDGIDASLRLVHLHEASEDWKGMQTAAERILAVNPLTPAPHRYLARAAEALGNHARAIPAYRALLRMDPVDPAEAHFRLARLLYREGDLASARREVLKSLEEAPRFRAAGRLLLEIVERTEDRSAPPKAAPAPEPRR
jgi:tetratricopeptide (TPR) repeat protein